MATFTALQLQAVVHTLPPGGRLASKYDAANRTVKRSYTTQQQHLDRWLGEYNSPGFYGRKNHDGDARAFYNHFRCVAGLLWLAEALGEDPEVLKSAIAAVDAGGSNPSTQCAAFRRRVPWTRVEELLQTRRQSARQQLFPVLAGYFPRR